MDGLEAHWIWLIAAAVLGIAEMVIPGVFLIWLAAAAALTAVVTLALGIDPVFQIALFGLFTIGSLYAGRRWYTTHPDETSDPLLNDRAARLVGENVLVISAIEHGRGRVAVGDSAWPARGPDAPVGARVRVVGAEGTCLRVERLPLPNSETAGINPPD